MKVGGGLHRHLSHVELEQSVAGLTVRVVLRSLGRVSRAVNALGAASALVSRDNVAQKSHSSASAGFYVNEFEALQQARQPTGE